MKKVLLFLFVLSIAFAQLPEYRLARGWNIIGGSDMPFSVTAIDTIGPIVPPIYQYNPLTSVYDEADTIKPLYGYWVLSAESLIVGTVIDTTPPPSTVTDIDGNEYETVIIGEQCWMAENLKVTHYRDGTPIQHLFLDSLWSNVDISDSGAYCYYDNDTSNIANYGLLYNWFAVDNEHGLCPTGWYVPSDEDWQGLELYLGMDSVFVDSLAFRGTNQGSQLAGISELWASGILEDDPGFGSSGFDAVAAGTRSYSGPYSNWFRYGYFWASTEKYSISAWMRSIADYRTGVNRGYGSKLYGNSVRCIRY